MDRLATVKKLGYYSNSQNGLVVSMQGIAPCLSGGAWGMMSISLK